MSISDEAVAEARHDAFVDAVEAIVRDIRARDGLRQEWDGIDEGLRREIKAEWVCLIEKAFEGTPE